MLIAVAVKLLTFYIVYHWVENREIGHIEYLLTKLGGDGATDVDDDLIRSIH